MGRAALLRSQSPAWWAERLREMLRIRHFEVRAEEAYRQGEIGGFFHSYTGQEPIQCCVVSIFGVKNWYITSYRCHALALLLGATPDELMAELFGRAPGNAKGRGGSMHFFTERLLGGFGIVGGQIPIATGAAFAVKYQGNDDECAICFLGDGAVAQGTFHESLNLASLWDLPCLYVIENNHWGMGTPVQKAVAVPRLAEDKAGGYGMKGYTINGLDFFACYEGFLRIAQEMKKERRPVLVEVLTERLRGHSISDAERYRSKDEIALLRENDPLIGFSQELIHGGILSQEEYDTIDREEKMRVIRAVQYAEKAPWPDPSELEEDVF